VAAAHAQDAAASAQTDADAARADATALALRLAAAEELLGEVRAPSIKPYLSTQSLRALARSVIATLVPRC